jgi:copper chaperone CopZ
MLHALRAALAAACLLSLPFACVTPPKAPDFSTDTTPIDVAQVRLGVLGMSCPKCVSNVDLSLLRVPGVERVAINMKDGLVTVDLAESPKPTAAQLARAVDAAGLTLARIDPVAAGAAP